MPLPNIQNQIYGTLWLPYFRIDHDTLPLTTSQSNASIQYQNFKSKVWNRCSNKLLYKTCVQNGWISCTKITHEKRRGKKWGKEKKVVAEARSPSRPSATAALSIACRCCPANLLPPQYWICHPRPCWEHPRWRMELAWRDRQPWRSPVSISCHLSPPSPALVASTNMGSMELVVAAGPHIAVAGYTVPRLEPHCRHRRNWICLRWAVTITGPYFIATRPHARCQRIATAGPSRHSYWIPHPVGRNLTAIATATGSTRAELVTIAGPQVIVAGPCARHRRSSRPRTAATGYAIL